MDHNEARELVQQIADAMEQNAASLTPDVIRSAKQTEIGANSFSAWRMPLARLERR